MDTCQFVDKLDAFTSSFKYFKNKERDIDFSKIIDFNDTTNFKRNNVTEVYLQHETRSSISESESQTRNLGLIPSEEWKVYKVNERPGLIYITNPFTPAGQKYWIKECFYNYPKPPNVTNLDGKESRHKIQNSHNHWKHLRWTTLGYHHNWDTKVYSLNAHAPFPENLAELTEFLAEILNLNPYTAEAAIVNYYHLNSTLSGHVDQSEFDLQAPLFSISFGQPAIFLLGGKSKSVTPSAMIVRSGDVIVMAGESRLGYHAVPRILKSSEVSWSEKEEEEEAGWLELKNYLTKSRINLNVRQVFPCNKT